MASTVAQSRTFDMKYMFQLMLRLFTSNSGRSIGFLCKGIPYRCRVGKPTSGFSSQSFFRIVTMRRKPVPIKKICVDWAVHYTSAIGRTNWKRNGPIRHDPRVREEALQSHVSRCARPQRC